MSTNNRRLTLCPHSHVLETLLIVCVCDLDFNVDLLRFIRPADSLEEASAVVKRRKRRWLSKPQSVFAVYVQVAFGFGLAIRKRCDPDESVSG